MGQKPMHHIDTVFRAYNLSGDHSKDSFALGVRKWAAFIKEKMSQMPHGDVVVGFKGILDDAWKATHIRCQLAEKLASQDAVGTDEENDAWYTRASRIIMNIGFAFLGRNEGASGVMKIRIVEKELLGAEELLTFIWTEQPYCPDPEDRFGWRDHTTGKGIPTVIYWPNDHVDLKTSDETNEAGIAQLAMHFQERRSTAYREDLLSGQRAAFDALRLMLKARKEGLSAGGIKPRLHGLIIGPSGSGKTHVVRAVAESENLPLFEQSAASWMPQGARAEKCSVQKIAEFVGANDKGIIYLDEIEKPFPPDLSKTIPWERYCTDEFMSLLDAKVGQWDHWSARLAAKLDKSFFIVLSGAWQAAYTAAFRVHSLLGGDWTNLSIADTFLEENYLPPELLNRVSTNVIEVLPPLREELAEMILRVQRDLNVEVDEQEARQAAKEIAQERKGVRAVEEFLLKRWIRKQSEPEVPAMNKPEISP